MIKLNRIGNKLGLAGAVGVLLAIGMVANQMITESQDRGSTASGRPIAAGGRQLAIRASRPAQDSTRRLPTSGWRELPPKSKRPLPICSATRRAQAKNSRPRSQPPRAAGHARSGCRRSRPLMEGFTAAVEDLAKAQITLLAQIEKRSAVSDEWNKAVEAQLGSPADGEAGQPPRDRTSAVSSRCKGERAAGGGLEARRHRRCQLGYGDGQDRGPR